MRPPGLLFSTEPQRESRQIATSHEIMQTWSQTSGERAGDKGLTSTKVEVLLSLDDDMDMCGLWDRARGFG